MARTGRKVWDAHRATGNRGVVRRNHRGAQGFTALLYVPALDTEVSLGTFLTLDEAKLRVITYLDNQTEGSK